MFIVLCFPAAARAVTLDVCPSTCTYTTIADAAAAAGSGDVIDVAAGTWAECYLAVPAGVTLTGAGRASTIIDAQGCANAAAITLVDGATATDVGLLPHATSGTGALFLGNGSVDRIDVRGGVTGVVGAGGAADTVVVQHTLVAGDGAMSVGVSTGSASWAVGFTTLVQTQPLGTGVEVQGIGVLDLDASVVTGWAQGISTASNASCQRRWSDFFGNTLDVDGCDVPAGYADFAFDPLFVTPTPNDPITDDYHLQSSVGSWSGAAFVPTTSDSPGLDSAPAYAADIAAEADWGCNTPNLGAYGGTAEASRSGWTVCPVSNLTTGQGFVTLEAAVVAGLGSDSLQLRAGPIDASATDAPVDFPTGALTFLVDGSPGTTLLGDGAEQVLTSRNATLQLDGVAAKAEEVFIWFRNNSVQTSAGTVAISDSSVEAEAVVAWSVGLSTAGPFDVSIDGSVLGTPARGVQSVVSDRWDQSNANPGYDGNHTVSISGSTVYGAGGDLISVQCDCCSFGGQSLELSLSQNLFLRAAPTQASGGRVLTETRGQCVVDYMVHANVFDAVRLTLAYSGNGASGSSATVTNNLVFGGSGTSDGLLLQGNGLAGTADVRNNTFVGWSSALLVTIAANVQNNLIVEAAQDGFSGSNYPSNTPQYNAFWANGSPSDITLDATNITTCDPGFPSITASQDPQDFLTIPACLVDAGNPLFLYNDGPGDLNDIGATGGPGGVDLLAQFDADGDGAVGAVDCDDSDPTVFPGAIDACGDSFDQDCSGGDAPDFDGDGYEDESCGTATLPADCDDSDPSSNPGGTDLSCDAIDQDCDGADAEDFDGDGYLCSVDDCDDTDAAINPAATEACNGVDDDCDGSLPSTSRTATPTPTCCATTTATTPIPPSTRAPPSCAMAWTTTAMAPPSPTRSTPTGTACCSAPATATTPMPPTSRATPRSVTARTTTATSAQRPPPRRKTAMGMARCLAPATATTSIRRTTRATPSSATAWTTTATAPPPPPRSTATATASSSAPATATTPPWTRCPAAPSCATGSTTTATAPRPPTRSTTTATGCACAATTATTASRRATTPRATATTRTRTPSGCATATATTPARP